MMDPTCSVLQREDGQWSLLLHKESGQTVEFRYPSENQARYFAAVFDLGPAQTPLALGQQLEVDKLQWIAMTDLVALPAALPPDARTEATLDVAALDERFGSLGALLADPVLDELPKGSPLEAALQATTQRAVAPARRGAKRGTRPRKATSRVKRADPAQT
jgi:hypothetical protein